MQALMNTSLLVKESVYLDFSWDEELLFDYNLLQKQILIWG